jgi:steroid delta-isomerase-like uncharacterized protein
MSAENKSVIRRWVESFNRRDLEAGAQLMDANYVRHLPGLESRGPEGFKQVATAFLTGFPDSKLTIEDLIAEDDRVVVRFTVRGTHLGDFAGIPPTNRQIALPVIMVNQISHGKMAESWEVVDQLALYQALGSFPPAAATSV